MTEIIRSAQERIDELLDSNNAMLMELRAVRARVRELEAGAKEIANRIIDHDYQIQQVLGRALGFPNEPQFEGDEHVNVGPHVGLTLARIAASKIAAGEAV
jgi:hypothetical protein